MGYLDPLLEFLRQEVSRLADPKKPGDSPNWSENRAYADGERSGLIRVLDWIERNSKVSPDGAINTEDYHE